MSFVLRCKGSGAMGSGIFNKYVFESVNEDQLYKRCMEGLNDPTLNHFQLLSFASLTKENFKRDKYELEYIQSYLHAAKELAAINEQRTMPPGMVAISQYSYVLPILYLTRHCMELAIKRAIEHTGHHAKNYHGLIKLWSSFLSGCEAERSDEDKFIIKAMGKFVSYIDKLDPTGTKLRYSVDKDDYSIDTPLWVDSKCVANRLEQFVCQLESLCINICSTTNR